ncbi:serine/threonine kinase family protein [Plesiocystis pacifica SIR-1]|uniref:Serine/threonine kinase family protein n=2 Tax=Plesiocystis pacifica TaxID=191768 RepID=A6G9P3_9BACT|nr:serine/threonine kinase family protein [Plesiocystis pacifica SIR-1]
MVGTQSFTMVQLPMEGDRHDREPAPDAERLREYARSVGADVQELEDALAFEGEAEVLSLVEEFERARLWRRLRADTLSQEVLAGGRYRLERRIGAGSGGTVFEAFDVEFARKVAVKVMPLGDREVEDREAKALAALDHPNVVSIFDHGRREDCRWLVLELLDGPPLRGWATGKPAKEVLARYLEAGEGLEAAHRRGLVHRDFKPGNVMLHAEGRAVVTDFGLARGLESLRAEAGEHEALIGSGTLEYMPRERLMGAAGDERSDQFAFCVALWEALAGVHPFGLAPELDEQLAALAGPPRGRRRVPRRLRAPLERGLASLPGDRWPTMARLLEALRGAERPRLGLWAGSALVLALLVGGLGAAVTSAPEFQIHEDPVSDTDEAIREIRKGVAKHDGDAVLQGLRSGYTAAKREGRRADFRDLAMEVAPKLEEQGERDVAIYALHVAIRFCQDLKDEQSLSHAQSQFERLTNQP